MRRLLFLLSLLYLWTVVGHAQVVGPGFVNYVTSAPSGTCSQGAPAQIVMGSGDIYTCQSGTWGKGGGSGGGTVTSIATTSPITGGTITTTGTIACATCVTSAASLTSHGVMVGAGSQASATISASTTTTQALFATATDPAFRALAQGDLPAQDIILRCYPGLGDGLNAIAAGTYLQTNCYNNSGVTWTISRIGCFTDNAGSSTLSATNGAGTALLTGAVTCTAAAGGAAGTQGATVTIASTDVIKFTFIADGTSKQTGWFVTLTQ